MEAGYDFQGVTRVLARMRLNTDPRQHVAPPGILGRGMPARVFFTMLGRGLWPSG